MNIRMTTVLFLVFLGAHAPALARPTPLGTVFTYQGELKVSGVPANGLHDMQFRLYDAITMGVQVGSTFCAENVSVTDGRFTVSLDFGAQFAGLERFLEIDVRADTGLDCTDITGFAILTPRQSLSATPYSLFSLSAASAASATTATSASTAATATNATQLNGQAASFYSNAGNLTGTLPSATLSGSYGSMVNFTNPSNVFGGIFNGSGAGINNINASNISTGTLNEARLPVPLNLVGANDNHIFRVQNTSSTHGSIAIFGDCTGTGYNSGVYGQSLNSRGVYGLSVHGSGVVGQATADDTYLGVTYGVYGSAANQFGIGVFGFGRDSGVWGETSEPTGIGVYGRSNAVTGVNYGVYATSLSPSGYAGYFLGRGYFSGNVGIGTEYPSHPLTVQSPTISSVRLVGPLGTFGHGARLNFGDADYAYIEEDTDDNLTLRANRINVNGNVGLGLTTPSFQLQLSLNSAAKPTSSSWTISSDERLKKNIHTIDGALDQLMQLRGVTYQWIDPSTQGDMDGTYTGMIAQDVEKVFPEWVREDGNGYKTVTVIGFEGLAVEALRQLREEKDAEIAQMRVQHESANAELRARIDSLEKMIQQLIVHQSGGQR